MKIEYDPIRDLLYIYFASAEIKAAETITVAPGVYADFGRNGKLLGIEIIDASEVIGKEIEFRLPEVIPLKSKS